MRLEKVSHFDVLRSLCQPRESWDVKACDVIARIVCHMCDVIPSLGFCASLNFVTSHNDNNATTWNRCARTFQAATLPRVLSFRYVVSAHTFFLAVNGAKERLWFRLKRLWIFTPSPVFVVNVINFSTRKPSIRVYYMDHLTFYLFRRLSE